MLLKALRSSSPAAGFQGRVDRDGLAPPATLSSGLLPVIKERLSRERGSCVLDLGPLTTNKLAFFNEVSCRFYSDNFPQSLAERLRGNVPEEEFGVIDVTEMFPAGATPKLDVILVWDFFDFMSQNRIRELVSKLAQYSAPGAWIYFLISQTKFMPEKPASIDVALDNSLSYGAGPVVRQSPRWAPKVLEGLMPRFDICKLYLMKNGLQEHLFECTAE